MSKQQADFSRNIALWSMVGILCLTSFFFLTNLGAVSFWEDESWLAIGMQGSLLDLWQFAAERGVHPPAFFTLAYVLKPLIGDSEIALRWLSGITGLAGIALTYRLGVVMGGRKWGVFAALLLSGSIFMIYLARLARQYALYYTLSAAIVYFYWVWRSRPQGRTLLLIMLMQAAALYTHYFSGFVAVAIGAHALLTLPFKRTLQLAGALVISGLLFLPWVPAIVVQINSPLGDGLYYGVPDVPRVLDNYAGRVGNASLPLLVGLSLAGLMALIWQRRWSVLGLLALWIVGTFIPVLIVNSQFQWYIGRNMLYTLPAVMLLYGAGLAFIARGWRTIAALVVAGSFIGWGVYVFEAFWPTTPDWRSVMTLMARDARPDDLYVMDGEPYSTDYYLSRFLGERITITNFRDWLAAPDVPDRIWLMDGDKAINPELRDVLPEQMQLTRRIVREPIVIELHQRVPDAPQITFGDQLALAYLGDDLTARAGQALHIDLWWQALRRPDFNYSAGLQIWNEDGQLIAQQDGNFDSGRLDAQVLPPDVWVPDTRILQIPADVRTGQYTLRATVYDWRDGARLPADPAAPDDLAVLTTLTITAE